ncbi:hypothetical protein RUND412_007906 [Rhizina undulata]
MPLDNFDTVIAESLRDHLHISPPVVTAGPAEEPQTLTDASIPAYIERHIAQNNLQTFYGFTNLPPFELLFECISGFIQGTIPWLYMYREYEITELLRAVYSKQPSTGSSSRSDTATSRNMLLCEFLLVAAIGAHFLDEVAPETRSMLFLSARLHLGSGPGRDPQTQNDALVRMRCHMLAGFFCTFEKTILSRKHIDRAIYFAQSQGLHHHSKPSQFSDRDWVSWKRVWRSLIFLDGWLSATLGSLPKVVSPDDPIFFENYNSYSTDMNACLHAEMIKVGILMGLIIKDIYAPPSVNISQLRVYSEKLKHWHTNLPPFLKLSVALTEKHDSEQKGSILLTHCVYLGSIILLTRRILVEHHKLKNLSTGDVRFTKGRGRENVSGPASGAGAGAFHEADMGGISDDRTTEEFAKMCISAARQLATVIGILYMEGRLARQCWIAIHSAYTACLILFFDISRQSHATISEPDMNLIFNCLNCLAFCSTRDLIASRYLEILRPIYQAFLNLRTVPSASTPPSSQRLPTAPPKSKRPRMMSNVKTIDRPPPETNSDMIEALITHITNIMETPFGGEGTVLNGEFGTEGRPTHWRYLTPMSESLVMAVHMQMSGGDQGFTTTARDGSRSHGEMFDVDGDREMAVNDGMGVNFGIGRVSDTTLPQAKRRKVPFKNKEEYEAFFRRIS